MPFKKMRSLTDGEIDFMKVLWELGKATPEEIRESLASKGRKLTYGSIRNILVVMIDKGFVVRHKKGKVYLYSACIDKSSARKTMLNNLLDRVFDGSESNMVATLLSEHTVRREEMDEIRRIILNVKQKEDAGCEEE